MQRPNEVEFKFKQPKHPYPPSHRSAIFAGPSGTGKTSTAISLLLGPMKGIYSRVWVFSPSCAPGVDPLWDAWREHVKSEMDVPDDEQTMWSEWDPNVLSKLIEGHAKINGALKKHKRKKGFVALALIDDLADDPRIHGMGPLATIFVRGRHMGVACWILTQKLRSISLICRAQVCWMLVWRMRNAKERDAILEELSAVYPPKTLMRLYDMATTYESHSFWYVNLLAPKEDMFYLNFDQQMIVQSE